MAVVVAVVSVSVVADPAASPARAAGPLEITSIAHNGGPDAAPGNGICADSAGACTLRAALQEANALVGPVTVTVASGFAGGVIAFPDCSTTHWMSPSGVPDTGGALFTITASEVTLDLRNRIGVTTPSTCTTAAALYVNGADARIQNITGFFPANTSFLLGANSDGSTLANLTMVQTANNTADRGVVLSTGADDITVQDSRFGGYFYSATAAIGMIAVSPNATVASLTITGSTFLNDQAAGGACSTADGRGCRPSGIALANGTTVAGLVIRGNTFSDFDAANRSAIRLQGTSTAPAITLSDLVIEGNMFTEVDNNESTASATISLPQNRTLGGTNRIDGNTFLANASSAYAIWWDGLQSTGSAASNLTVTGNHFDGFGTASQPTVGVLDTGTMPFEDNTFGADTVGSILPAAETGNSTPFANLDAQANSDIRAWFPSTSTGPATPSIDNTACTITVRANPPTAGTAPLYPARIDVYWSSTSPSTAAGAEILLGSQTVSSALAQNITVPYTVGSAGRVRFQTSGAPRSPSPARQSSQYSRTLDVGASTCAPRIVIDRADGQSTPTSHRTVRFEVQSSAPLTAAGAGSLQATDLSTAGSTAPGAQVTSVTAVSSSLYIVTATANDTGAIVLSLPAGAVTARGSNVANLASTAAPSPGGNSIDYANPLSRAPGTLTVYEGGVSAPYTVTRAASLPATSDIIVAIARSNAYASVVTPVTIPSGDTTRAVPVASGVLGGTTRTTVLSHTVTSTDPNYNGLLLPTVIVTARPPAAISPASGPTAGGQAVAVTVAYLPAAVTGILFGTTSAPFTGAGGALTATTPPRPSPTGVNVVVDVTIQYADGSSVVLPGAYTYVPTPSVTVQKRAYADAAHTQPLAAGTDVLTGQRVYWTYTVTNTGETPLSALSVTDPELPAATHPGGVVCTIASLAAGAISTCAADAEVSP